MLTGVVVCEANPRHQVVSEAIASGDIQAMNFFIN